MVDQRAVPRTPLLPDVGILALPPDRWGEYWGSRHHLLTCLASWFHVVWVDPARGWRETWFGPALREPGPGGEPPPHSGFIRHTPAPWLPVFYRPAWLARATARARLQQARRALTRRGCRAIVLDLWKPYFAPALDSVSHEVSCYHVTDEYTYSPVELPVDPLEEQVLSRVDQVFILSRTSFDKKAPLTARSLLLGNGVDYRAFASPRREPADLAAIPHPRIGYVGSLKEHLDYDLLIELAQRHRTWSFVLVGPDRYLGARAPLLARLRALPNVHSLGPRPIDELPAYDQHMDVCLLCYEVNDYTKFVSPLKLREYLASGRPIVGSTLPAFEEFTGLIELVRTPQEWSDALARALEPGASAPDRIEARRCAARRGDWAHLVERVAGAICERLGPEYLKRFEVSLEAEVSGGKVAP